MNQTVDDNNRKDNNKKTIKNKTRLCLGIIPYQGFNWVDQLLCLHISSCGDRPDRKGDQTTRIKHQEQSFQNVKCKIQARFMI